MSTKRSRSGEMGDDGGQKRASAFKDSLCSRRERGASWSRDVGRDVYRATWFRVYVGRLRALQEGPRPGRSELHRWSTLSVNDSDNDNEEDVVVVVENDEQWGGRTL